MSKVADVEFSWGSWNIGERIFPKASSSTFPYYYCRWIYWCFHYQGITYWLQKDRKCEPMENFIHLVLWWKLMLKAFTPDWQWLKSINVQQSKLIGMGFDGAATFSGKKSGVQEHVKSTHQMLYLSIVIAINFNKLVYRLLMPQQVSRICKSNSLVLRNLFHYCSKCAQYSPRRGPGSYLLTRVDNC